MTARNPGPLLLHHPITGQWFEFEPGALSLAFIVTGSLAAPDFEQLHHPADLVAWVEELLEAHVQEPSATEFAAAIRLREAIWDLANAKADGRPLPRRAIDEVNEHASPPPLVPRIDAAGARTWLEPVTTEQALSDVARDAVELFSGPLAERVRRCEGEHCALVFADTSRSGRRRWCSMQRCGNRAKARAYRERTQQEDTR